MGVTNRADDWKRVNEDHPDVAEFITEIAEVFGKPAVVVVKEGDEVILDSRKYRG